MLKKLWINYINCGLEDNNENIEILQVLKPLTSLSACVMPVLLLHIGINLFTRHYMLFYIESGIFFIQAINIIYLRISRNTKIFSTVILILAIILFSFLFYTGGTEKTGIFWLFSFPLLALFLKSIKQGIIWIGTMLAIVSTIILLCFREICHLPYKGLELRQFFLSYLVIAILAYFYARQKENDRLSLVKSYLTDSLTKLPNRQRLLEDLKACNHSQLILLNIDDFKLVNDFYGHAIGDYILVRIADRLKSNIGPEEHCIYKLHADEYCILFIKPKSEEEIRLFVNFLHKNLTLKFFNYKGQDIALNVTVGIAGKSKGHILENANIALKSAKEQNKDFCFYEPSMRQVEQYSMNMELIKMIKDAIAKNDIFPYFQPILHRDSNEIRKYECLARIPDNKGEVLEAEEFIDVAKKTKLLTYITRIMIKKTFEFFHEADCSLTINISLEDMQNKYTIAFLKKNLKKYKIGSRVTFEILESDSIENYADVSAFINGMKKFGCKVAIDDFGTGYCNFSHLMNLNVDFIKIDGSLIKDICNNKNSQVIVESIVNICRQLKIKTIAEFIHCRDVFNKAKSLNVDYFQGYYIGKPGKLKYSDLKKKKL